MANFFTQLFSAGASSLVDAVGDAIDKNFTSDEERQELENEMLKASMQYDIEMKTLGIEETKAYLADTDSARDNQSRVQESENSSWLAKNVHPILAVAIIGLTFFMYFWIIQTKGAVLKETGMKEIIIYILGALTTISTQVAAYFFGSSQGSKDKQKSLDNIANKR
jgi:nitrate reductase NapE component